MALFRNKYLLCITLFLAVILQGLIPFLHAHTGTSSKIGLHMHVVTTGIEVVANPKNESALILSDLGESPEVGVPSSRENDQLLLSLPDLLAFVFLAFPLVGFVAYQILFDGESTFFIHKLQAQNSPPPALAPPHNL